MKIKQVFSGIILAGIIFVIFLLLFTGKEEKKAETSNSIIGDIPVTVMKIKKITLSDDVSLVGVINPYYDIIVVSQTHGLVTADYTDVGKHVRADEVIAKIDDVLMQSNMAREEINYLKSKRDFERNQKLYEQNSISASQLDLSRLDMKSAENQLTIAKKSLDDTKIKAPISGIINYSYINLGSTVSEGTQIANIVDISRLKVIVNASERDAFRLKTGDNVDLETDVYPGVTFKGKIENIAAKADEAHTYRVTINLPNNSANPLKAGMFARIYFTNIASGPALAIPRESLIGSVKDAQCFIVENGFARLRKITIGKESSQMLEVINGLNEDDMVVTSGQNNLSDSIKVLITQ